MDMVWKHLLDNLIPHLWVWSPSLYLALNKTFYCYDFFYICGFEDNKVVFVNWPFARSPRYFRCDPRPL